MHVTSVPDNTGIKSLEIPQQNKVQKEEIMIAFKQRWVTTAEGISDPLVHTVTMPILLKTGVHRNGKQETRLNKDVKRANLSFHFLNTYHLMWILQLCRKNKFKEIYFLLIIILCKWNINCILSNLQSNLSSNWEKRYDYRQGTFCLQVLVNILSSPYLVCYYLQSYYLHMTFAHEL